MFKCIPLTAADSHISLPLSIRLIHIQIKPHQLQSTDSTPARHAEKCMARVQSDWALGAFTLFISQWQRLVALLSSPREKTTLYGKTRSKGAGVTGKLPDPDIRPPWWTRHVGLSLQSFVNVVIFLMLFGKGWQRTRRPCPRSEEKCKKTLRPQPFTVQLRETRFLILIFLHKFVFLVWVLKSVIVLFQFLAV